MIVVVDDDDDDNDDDDDAVVIFCYFVLLFVAVVSIVYFVCLHPSWQHFPSWIYQYHLDKLLSPHTFWKFYFIDGLIETNLHGPTYAVMNSRISF